MYTCNASISHVRTGCQCGNEVYTCNAGMTDPSESCVYVDVGFRPAYQLESSGCLQKFQHNFPGLSSTVRSPLFAICHAKHRTVTQFQSICETTLVGCIALAWARTRSALFRRESFRCRGSGLLFGKLGSRTRGTTFQPAFTALDLSGMRRKLLSPISVAKTRGTPGSSSGGGTRTSRSGSTCMSSMTTSQRERMTSITSTSE